MDSASRAGAATVGANSPVAMLPSSTQRLLYVGQLPANRLVGIPATDPEPTSAALSWLPRSGRSDPCGGPEEVPRRRAHTVGGTLSNGGVARGLGPCGLTTREPFGAQKSHQSY
jgi:hypothetical protein